MWSVLRLALRPWCPLWSYPSISVLAFPTSSSPVLPFPSLVFRYTPVLFSLQCPNHLSSLGLCQSVPSPSSLPHIHHPHLRHIQLLVRNVTCLWQDLEPRVCCRRPAAGPASVTRGQQEHCESRRTNCDDWRSEGHLVRRSDINIIRSSKLTFYYFLPLNVFSTQYNHNINNVYINQSTRMHRCCNM